MDLNSLIAPLLAGGSPWMIAAGVALSVLYNRFLGKQPQPLPLPLPTPAPALSGRPVLDLLLSLLRSRGAAAVAQTVAAASPTELIQLRAEVEAKLAEFRAALAPEPSVK